MTGGVDGLGAVVTGGSSGIGLATVAALLRDGAFVVAVGRSSERLDRAAEALEAQGLDVTRLVTVSGDVADADTSERAVRSAERAERGFGIAVAAAGVAGAKPLLSTTASDVQPYIETNVYGPLNLIRSAGQAMADTGGAICVVSSNVSHRAPRFAGGYCISKAAVDALVGVAADELGPLGIRVNAVRPGLTETPMVDRVLGLAPSVEAMEANTPLGGWSQAADVASTIRFLVGPESSRITGEHVVVDGGQSARRVTDFVPIADVLFPDMDDRLLP